MNGSPIGLDFTAVMLVGAGQDADLELLAETLPDFEAILVAAIAGESTFAPDEEFS